MFSSEVYGYNKKEVDDFIANLKAEHERALMQEKLKVLETEKKMLDIKKKIESREQAIYNVLESYKKAQAEGTRNIEVLRGEQLRMVYLQLQTFMQDLNTRVPGVLLNSNYKKLISDIEIILYNAENKKEDLVGAGTDNDSMRILLNKMQGKKTQEPVKEVKIERNSTYINKPSQIKPVTQMQLNEDDDYDNLVDKFLNSEPPEEQPKSLKIQSSGFDLKEAINPKQDLSEIMKAFDFYSGDDED